MLIMFPRYVSKLAITDNYPGVFSIVIWPAIEYGICSLYQFGPLL